MANPRDFGKKLKADDVVDFKGPLERAQKVGVRIFDRPPAPNEVGEGEHVFADYNGSSRMFVKIKGKLKSIVLT